MRAEAHLILQEELVVGHALARFVMVVLQPEAAEFILGEFHDDAVA